MTITDLQHICPYTGLRAFTEEESLYFKGRDLQVDQITSLLEQNKFLMVTGASGEGKSSLIYGGLIPNARAGFFKARYTNWIVADFRPERNPVTNMAVSIAEQFGSNSAIVETELRRGFSSLIDLYTNSSFYTGEEDDTWKALSDNEKKDRKRKAANLIILTDQFEEFFTNPENFFNEVLSKDSQIVVNLLLETARIALRKNLPVYVVCTMRSDYIGQCSAFRGLPEYIGFSQFFVPRLKRKDLKQVIEEPAVLSGNCISQRLIERLVFDISEGIDQLPILQHALSRIWAAADNGSEEMDLLHYAMVGGMAPGDLPDENIPAYRKWFALLPENQKSYYNETGLNKIIEIHANLLYENAWEYYNNSHAANPVTQQEAKRIIALAFSCLTKIDNSRAVRNRMSLEEITAIINTPKFTVDVVGDVLNIFREEGNSFIRPFKSEDPATQKLLPGTVLDITHESLIRNWNKLNKWATREFEFYTTFLDFQKQLDRWKKSGKSRGYLLPIGPLSYFENWYNTCKPNVGWIKRYAEATEDTQQAVNNATNVLGDTKQFLRRSARKEMMSRAFMKYGPRRIAAVFAIGIMLTLTGFYWYDADQKKNANVIDRVRSEASRLLKSADVDNGSKAVYLLVDEVYDSGSLQKHLQKFAYKDKLLLGIQIYDHLLKIDKTQQNSTMQGIVEILGKNLNNPEAGTDPELLLNQTNEFLSRLAMDEYYMPDKIKSDYLVQLTEKNYAIVMHFFRNKALYRPAIAHQMNVAIQLWLSKGSVTAEKLNLLLDAMSPQRGIEAAAMFNTWYPKGSFENNGRQPGDNNGGYHTLASLYAALGDIDNISWCFRQLLESNQRDYFELPRLFNNHLNIVGYLYQYGHRDKVPLLLSWLNTNTDKNTPLTILRNIILRAGYISHLYRINTNPGDLRTNRGYLFPNLFFCNRVVFDSLMNDYEKEINRIPDLNERRYNLAMNMKRKAMFYHKYWYDRHMPVDSNRLDNWLNQAVQLYLQTDKKYMEDTVSSTIVYNADGVRTTPVKRKILFIYPDYRDGWFSATYHTDYFFKYLLKNGLLDTVYKTAEDLESLHFWVAKAHEYKVYAGPNDFSNSFPFPDYALRSILSFVDNHPNGKAFDRNLFYLLLANRALDRGDTLEGISYYHQLDIANIQRSANKYEYLEKVFLLNMLKDLSVKLALAGKTSEAVTLAETFSNDYERIFSYIEMADKVYSKDAKPVAFIYLDSAFSKYKNIDYQKLPRPLDSRYNLISVLSRIGSKSFNEKADDLLSDIQEGGKYGGIFSRTKGIAQEGNYYRALTSIPNTLTESQDLASRAFILFEASREREHVKSKSLWKPIHDYFFRNLIYIDYAPN